VIASALAAGLAIVMLAQGYQFGEAVAGQREAGTGLSAGLHHEGAGGGLHSHQPVAYLFVGAGAMIAVVMEMLGAPALVFALGMYLPLELNLPALVGGVLAHYLERRASAAGGTRGSIMRERGVIIASGFMAGGALGGVIGAALRLIPCDGWHFVILGRAVCYAEDAVRTPFFDIDPVSQIVST